MSEVSHTSGTTQNVGTLLTSLYELNVKRLTTQNIN